MLKLVFSCWYIVNSSWVKKVNNLRKQSSKSGVILSTKQYILKQTKNIKWVKSWFIQQSLPHYPTTLYTYLNKKINLLIKSFTYYPHSLLMSLLKEN